MKTTLFLIPALSFFIFVTACSGGAAKQEAVQQDSNSRESKAALFMKDCSKLRREAQKLDSTLLKQTEINTGLANTAIKAFTDFVYHCQSDSISPIYLIKTAQVARAINNIPQAKIVLEKCISDYPNFKDPAAIFLLAQLYDEVTYLNNEQEAKVLYQKIIDEYPKSDWAASAKGAISFIGKSDAQIMEELRKKHK